MSLMVLICCSSVLMLHNIHRPHLSPCPWCHRCPHPPTLRAVNQRQSVCLCGQRQTFGVILSSCSMKTSSRPSNTGNPLTSASQLCCGHMSVCIFLRHRSCVHVPESDGVFFFFSFSGGGGVTVLQCRPTDRSPEGHTQEKLNKHNCCLFLRTLPDTLIGWPMRQPFLSLVPLPPPLCSSL